MKEEINFGIRTLLVAFFGGGTAGAMAALLTAPVSDAEAGEGPVGIARDSRGKLARISPALRPAASEAQAPATDALAEAMNQVNDFGKNDRTF